MQIEKSPIDYTSGRPGWMENGLTRPLSLPKLPKLPKQQNLSYLSGAKISWMSSLRKPMTNSLPIVHMTIPLNFILTLSLKSPKSIPSTWWKWKLVKLSSRNTLKRDTSYHWNPPKLLLSSLYQRRMEPYIHVKITTTWTPTQSETPTLSPSSLN